MKILKPGKVEQRKFVCPRCGCIFVADSTENGYQLGSFYVDCPCCKNAKKVWWDDGEPYEEPTPTQTDREQMAQLLVEVTQFCNFGEKADYLISHGVTFREEQHGEILL